MALRNIFLQNEPSLRKICKDVTSFDIMLGQLFDDMHETLALACGVGLAGNQIGILRNICILHDGSTRLEFVNPKIIRMEGEAIDTESCLSCPGEYGKVKRPQMVEVAAFDRNGKPFSLVLKDLDARIICHETDHLQGRLFKDIAFDLQKVS
ncbi:MAG: peptide deformylase [Oscillospiraceae bacterium]|jgi:peptide deformylase|nr:peptide deformylase [Oscillospiraceae bacterium]